LQTSPLNNVGIKQVPEIIMVFHNYCKQFIIWERPCALKYYLTHGVIFIIVEPDIATTRNICITCAAVPMHHEIFYVCIS
jgi:hypothetical protein